MTTQISMLERPAPAGELVLRPYQAWSVDELARAKRDGHLWTILCSPTGSGKTEISIHLIDRARKRGMRVAFVCDRRTLVTQTSQRFAKYGIPHGVAMAEKTFGRSMPIQICSVQTIQKRGYWPALDLLVIDEAHTQHKGVLEFAKNWGGPVIGLTATPLTEGLGQWYSKVVNAVTTDRLLADGYLAPLKIYAATEIDMAGAKKTAGEWQKEEVRKRGRPIIGDIVSTYERMTRQHFGGPVKTLLFSADIAHGEELCKAFQMAGHDFRQSTYRDSEDSTEATVEAFRRGDFKGLVSVEKFVKGFDVPDVLCMIGARPYSSSLASVIQQMGRGMRTHPGKEFCLYLDHAGNVEGWYDDVMDFWANGVDRLDVAEKRKPKRREGEDRPGCGLRLRLRASAGHAELPVLWGCASQASHEGRGGAWPHGGMGSSKARRVDEGRVVGLVAGFPPGTGVYPRRRRRRTKEMRWLLQRVIRAVASMGPSAQAMRRARRREGIEASQVQPDPVRQIAEGRMTTGMIVCAQGDPQCYQAGCRRTPTLQCDYRVDHWGRTCNAWMCESDALHIGFGRDHCMGHQPPKEQARMAL